MCLSARAAFCLTVVCAAGLVATGCGGDDDEPERTTAPTAPAETLPAPVTTPPPETTPMPGARPERHPPAVPEQEGDEEAIRSEAVFTGRGGRLRPRVVRVPAYIAIRVILRSADGKAYSLAIGGTGMHAGGKQGTDELELDGLLPGRAYRGTSPEGNVRVVASAEPGP